MVAGSLDGAGSLHLMNNATLILDTSDTRTGPTTIDAGSTPQLDNITMSPAVPAAFYRLRQP